MKSGSESGDCDLSDGVIVPSLQARIGLLASQQGSTEPIFDMNQILRGARRPAAYPQSAEIACSAATTPLR
jgi:hypothetical protein